MANFCYDCTTEHFGTDALQNDFHSMITEREVEKGFLLSVLCEGCGHIMINHEGKRVKTLDEYVKDATGCKNCLRNERKWEFRYENQTKRIQDLEQTTKKLRRQIRELKK